MYRNTESYEIVKSVLLEAVPRANVLKSREEGDVLLVINHKYSLYFLNRVAKSMLMLCNGERTIKDIIHLLHNRYDVDEQTLTNDIIDAVRDLQIKRIIHVD